MKIRKGVLKMNDLIQLIVNNGIGVVCVAYLIFFQATTMKDITKSMAETTTSLKLMNQDLEEIKDKLNGRKS